MIILYILLYDKIYIYIIYMKNNYFTNDEIKIIIIILQPLFPIYEWML